MIKLRGRGMFVRMFGSAIVMQGMLSAASFATGLILIRRTTNEDYGHYVLVVNAILLIVALQAAFFQPHIVARLAQLDTPGRAQLVGGLLRTQWSLLAKLVAIACIGAVVLLVTGFANWHTTVILLVGTAAISTALFREFFRLILFAYRQPIKVLRADSLYVVLMIGGAMAATYTAYPAIFAVANLGLAALIGGFLQARGLKRFEAWTDGGSSSTWSEVAATGMWATTGSALHWAFSQGYSYLAAGTLSVAAVAAIASMRLLLMPLNLISTGIGTLMLPTVTGWMKAHGTTVVFRRLLLISAALALLALAYVAVIWIGRDWISSHVLKKRFDHQDALLIMWSLVFVVTLFRDQLLQLPMCCGRFRSLASITLVSTVVALAVCYVALMTIGETGAPLGVLVGEICNLTGIVYVSFQEIRRERTLATATVMVSR